VEKQNEYTCVRRKQPCAAFLATSNSLASPQMKTILSIL
jgi:hypothetical protein